MSVRLGMWFSELWKVAYSPFTHWCGAGVLYNTHLHLHCCTVKSCMVMLSHSHTTQLKLSNDHHIFINI